MKFLFYVIGLLAFVASILAGLTSKSAIHEILSVLLMLVSVTSWGFAGTMARLDDLISPPDDGRESENR